MKSVKITNLFSLYGFSQAQNAPKPFSGPGSAPDPAGGAYNASPEPVVGWGWGYPVPIPHFLYAFGVSISAPAVLCSSNIFLGKTLPYHRY